MKKIIALSVATALSCSLLQAKAVEIDGKDAGNIDLMFKAMTVIDDKENGYAPSNGSGYLVKLKYETASILTEGLKVGVGVYVNGDMGLTEWDEKPRSKGANKGAYGMVVDDEGDSKALMGELHLRYSNDIIDAKIGRQTIKTPLTVIKTSLMPNFYEAGMVDAKVGGGLKVTAGHIYKMAFGSRAAADWGMIGERTGTAGVGTQLTNDPANSIDGKANLELVNQAEFYNVGNIAGVENTNGRSTLGLTYNGIKNLKADLWVYHSYDIATDYYAELKYKIPVSKGLAVKLDAQYLMQKDAGDSLAGDRDFSLYGVKASFGSKKWGVFAAYNQSSDEGGDWKGTDTEGQYFNAWGADPAYTSSIYSRNAYRRDVTAYKVGGHYVIMKGLKLMINYSDYGQSHTRQSSEMAKPGAIAGNDAYEVDTVLVYKPNKQWMFKLFNAVRRSEFDSTTGPATDGARQNQYRVIASYTF